MKRLSMLFTFVALAFTAASAYAQVSSTSMVEDWQRAKTYTKEYLDAMPADGYALKPKPEMRSFAGQMLHIADANYFFVATASGKDSPLGKTTSAEKTIPQTKEATTKAVMDSYDFVINAVQGMTPAQMQETMTIAGKSMTKGTALAKDFEHQTHHRGQCTVYLRLKGVTPPPEKLF